MRSITTTADAVSTLKTRTVTCLKSSPARTAAADGIHETRQAAAKQVNTVSTADGLRSARQKSDRRRHPKSPNHRRFSRSCRCMHQAAAGRAREHDTACFNTDHGGAPIASAI